MIFNRGNPHGKDRGQQGMNADGFTRRWLGLFALMAGLLAIAPHLIHVLVQNSGCHDVSGGCENMTDLLTLYGRRVILAAILIPLVIALAGRALTVEAFAWAFPFGLLMIAGATPLFFEAAEFAMTGKAIDLLAHPAFTPLLFLVLLLVGLSAYPDDRDAGSARIWRALLGVVATLSLFVTAASWLPGVAELPYAGQYVPRVALLLGGAHAALGIGDQLAQFGSYCLIAFVLGAAGLVVSGRSDDAPRPIRTLRA